MIPPDHFTGALFPLGGQLSPERNRHNILGILLISYGIEERVCEKEIAFVVSVSASILGAE